MAASKKEKPIIEVKHLSKQYNIGVDRTYKTFCDSFTSAVRHPLKTLKDKHQPNDTFWSLKDVNFEVERGDVVGIIGRNGAGKSTLLKILSRITYPTEGEIRMHGRVGSLLEVGTGFHPELTGRENIYFNGAILGMKKREIDDKFDEIVKFSGVDKFLDTPVKRYSSGMQVRLAFSVAAHLEPEILVVDEVLAVGDAEFQKKCLGKMRDVADGGKTILFVSHNMGVIRRLCQRGIVLSEGQLIIDDIASEAIDTYIGNISKSIVRKIIFDDDPNLPINILEVKVNSPSKSNSEVLDISDPIDIEVCYRVKEDIKGTNVAINVMWNDTLLFRTWDIDSNQALFSLRKCGYYVAQISLPPKMLMPGRYTLDVNAGHPGIGTIVDHPQCISFELENNKMDLTKCSYSRGGMINIPLTWNIKKESKI